MTILGQDFDSSIVCNSEHLCSLRVSVVGWSSVLNSNHFPSTPIRSIDSHVFYICQRLVVSNFGVLIGTNDTCFLNSIMSYGWQQKQSTRLPGSGCVWCWTWCTTWRRSVLHGVSIVQTRVQFPVMISQRCASCTGSGCRSKERPIDISCRRQPGRGECVEPESVRSNNSWLSMQQAREWSWTGDEIKQQARVEITEGKHIRYTKARQDCHGDDLQTTSNWLVKIEGAAKETQYVSSRILLDKGFHRQPMRNRDCVGWLGRPATRVQILAIQI